MKPGSDGPAVCTAGNAGAWMPRQSAGRLATGRRRGGGGPVALLSAFALVACATAAVAATPPPRSHPRPFHKALPLRLVRDVRLPGRATRFDYESFDPRTGLLFISHLGDSEVLRFNTRTQRLQGAVAGVSRVHGVLAVPALGRVYASATGFNQVFAINERTLRILARIPGGVYPDGMAYVPGRHRLFVSDELGGTDTVINTTTQRRVATIPLGGHAGNTQYDAASGLIYVDVQTQNLLKAINPKTLRVVASYSLPGCQHDHGLNIDSPARLAFVACDHNARLLTFDLRTHRVLASHRLGKYPDVLKFDSGLQRLYVAAESGVVSVFALCGRQLHLLGRAHLAYEAHSVAVDSQHRVYFPLQNIDGHPLLRIMRPVAH